MSNVAALKKKAAEFEQRKQLDKAIAAYREILDLYDGGGEEQMDVGLYNRVADLLLRQGATPEAVTLFERAVDLYTEGGFFNNAIALCNKILRTSPGRASVYYKLGKISAAKGFKADAKLNFLEYADRMQKAGEMQEAFRALKEFADLCPDQDDIRLLLADQLTRADKKNEALEQLQILHSRYESEGRTTEATATIARMKAIDPGAKVQSVTARSRTRPEDDLVFLDLSAPAPRAPRRSLGIPRQPTTDPALPLIHVDPPAAVEASTTDSIAFGEPAGFERTPLGEGSTKQGTPLPPSVFAEIDLDAILEVSSGSTRAVDRDLALPGDLPPIDASALGRWREIGSLDRTSSPASAGGTGAVPLEPEADLVTLDIEPTAITGDSSSLAESASSLAARLVDEPDNWALHRAYAEALLEAGDSELGLRELERALVGFERGDDLAGARAIADEIIRLHPGSVRYHQKRVEYAFRTNDRLQLVDAYIELADALFRDGQAEKAKAVYERVIEIAPENMRAHTALEAYAPSEHSGPGDTPASTPAAGDRTLSAARAGTPIAPTDNSGRATAGDDEYVSLGDWLRAEQGPRTTRMVAEEEEPSGDEQRDFREMLQKFKQGVAANVDEEDHAAHYDLGVAYKEMGLLDEAISQFQKAFRGNTHRVRTYEALGQCFLEKQRLPVALSILQRALHEPGVGEEQLVGVLYLLGYINESMGRHAEAKGFYERVFGVDIEFRDVGERLAATEKALA